MFSFRRLLPSHAAARFAVQIPLWTTPRWKYTATTGTQGARVVPQLWTMDFAHYKKHVDKIVWKVPTTEEKEALAQFRANVRKDLQHFCAKVEAVDPAILRNQWDTAVRGASDLEGALLEFLDSMNHKLKTKLREEDLEDPSFFQWGRAFVEAHFESGVFLEYAPFIEKLKSTMTQNETDYNSAVLATDTTQLQGLSPDDRNVNQEVYRLFSDAANPRRRSFEKLHFICGDSGSGKTHFAINAPSRLPQEETSTDIVFYLNAGEIPDSGAYATVVEQNEVVKKEGADADSARAKRNEAACKILSDWMIGAMNPYRLKALPDSQEKRHISRAFLIFDEAITKVPMIRALTSKKDDSALKRLNSEFKGIFRCVYVFAASTASSEYVRLLDSSESEMVVFDMIPNRSLIESGLSTLKELNALWAKDIFFFFLTHNMRCSAEVLHVIEVNRSPFNTLHNVAEKFEASKKYETEDGKTEVVYPPIDVEEFNLSTLMLRVPRTTRGIVPFAVLKGRKMIKRDQFNDIMFEVSSWLSMQAIIYYKAQGALHRKSVEHCRDIVMRAVFLCITGKTAQLKKALPKNDKTGADHGEQEDAEATSEDPITKGVVAVRYRRLSDSKKVISYTLGVHHIVMAMLNYGEGVQLDRVESNDTKSAMNDEQVAAPQPASATDGQRTAATASGGVQRTIDDTALKKRQELQDLVTADDTTAQHFLVSFLHFLCECVLAAKGRGDELSFKEILCHFRYPEPSVQECPTEKEVWDAIHDGGREMTVVDNGKLESQYPFYLQKPSKPAIEVDSNEDNHRRALHEKSLDALCGDCSKFPNEEKPVRIIQNAPNAHYADIIVICGKVLLLVSVKKRNRHGLNAEEVREDTATLGFSIHNEQTFNDPQQSAVAESQSVDGSQQTTKTLSLVDYHVESTKNLARRFGCNFAVPVFALFEEPADNFTDALPFVDVSVSRDSSTSEPKLMKPITLYVKPYLQKDVTD